MAVTRQPDITQNEFYARAQVKVVDADGLFVDAQYIDVLLGRAKSVSVDSAGDIYAAGEVCFEQGAIPGVCDTPEQFGVFKLDGGNLGNELWRGVLGEGTAVRVAAGSGAVSAIGVDEGEPVLTRYE